MPKPLPSVLALLTLLLINQGARSEQRPRLAIPAEAGCSGADTPAVAPTPAGIAAKAWAIFDGKTGKPLWGFHDAEARPIASTTKIMTAWIILQRVDKDPKLLDEEIRFSERAAATRGSSCRLKVGERLPVRELLYGLLLPSGNDAAVALAEHFGSRWRSDESDKEDSVDLFVAEMNRQAKSLKLTATNFLDPNGLARNQASAHDLAVLTWHAMQNRRFREYVKTREHECEVLGDGDTKRRVTWKNTNRLLEDANCDGVKTGTTNAAGACLVASAQKRADHLIVVVLGSTNGDGRYEDARKLFQWAWKQRAGKTGKLKEGLTLAPWGADPHPTDAPKRHIEKIAIGRHVYVVHQGGTLDGANCRSPIGVGMMDGPAIEQTWESNRAVRLENTGETVVINPWLANGRNGYRTLDEIVASAVKPGMTDREKAHALWFQEISHRYHAGGDNNELGDPVKVFNIYGHNTCGNDSICLAGLWKRAGLKVTPARVVGHCVTQAFFDGRWNLFDGDMHSMYLLRDNHTIACEQDLVHDHDLIKRTHTQGVLNPDKRANDEWEASIYLFEGPPAGDRNCAQNTSMNMVLRPGEAITWRWGHTSPLKYHGEKPRYPDTICNGLWEYRPDFSRDLWKKGAASVVGIQTKSGELITEGDNAGVIIWIIRSPYVLVGGRIESEGSGAKFSLSWDGKSWQKTGPSLDKFFPPAGPARYEYRLRCELDTGGHLRSLGIVNDIQMAPLALPAMTVGDNQFVYTDQSPGRRRVSITHDWVERSASPPPEAPATPTFPPDKGEVEGTHLVFRWPAPKSDIADYHFELSDRPDMSWPLSPTFYRLISKTADRGKSQYTLPHAGLLAVDRQHYWRVRAKNAQGAWGAWSATWSFTPRGPAAPTDIALAIDRDQGTGVLRWKPNPISRKPAKYRIYGSDEKGFTISDAPYKAIVGVSKLVSADRPGNFMTEVSVTEAAVIGAEINLPNANRAYYRVVAVDEKGNRSGPSDFAEAPRPLLWSRPVTVAKVGSEYRYAVATIRSLGDLRTRVVQGKETMNYWDIEDPRYALEQGPSWLKIDQRTGVLYGVPQNPGKVVIAVTATIDREVRKLDEQALRWGMEKTLSTSTQRVGTATQTFTLKIAPQ